MIRYDYSTGEYLTLPAKFREDGTLSARSIITSIGVFPYRQADGSIRRELRLPEEVFSKDTLDSFNNMPIYVGHKMGRAGLEKDQQKRDEWSVGVAKNPIGDNVYVATDVEITKQDGLDAIKAGVRSFSTGYTCDLEPSSGVWCGGVYDVIQRNIRGDHLALVPVGRQGDQAVLRMDSAEMVVEDTTTKVDKNKEDRMADNMKTIQLDSVDYQAEEAVVNAYTSEKVRADTLADELEVNKKSISTLEAERDSAKERVDALVLENEELKKVKTDEAEIAKRVEARIALVALAEEVKAEVRADMSDLDMKKAILIARNPKLKLDEKDATYIDVRIDCVREDLTLEKDKVAQASVAGASGPAIPVVNADSAEEAYKRMLEKLHKQGRE